MTEYMLIIFFAAFLYLLSRRENKNRTRNNGKINYGKVSQTIKGEFVRSKGEKRIADWLYSNNINYSYEPKLSRFVPDFFLPEHGIVIEYYGLRDAPGKLGHDYRQKILSKRGYFSSLSVKLLELYQEDLSRLDNIIPDMLLKQS